MDLEVKDPSPYSMDELVQWYIQLRDYKSDVKKSIAAQLQYADEQMDVIGAELGKRLTTSDLQSARTSNGTVMRVQKSKYSVTDPHALRQWVIANPEIGVGLLTASVAQGEVTAYLEEDANNTLPDGLAVDRYFDISVRRS